LVSCCYPATFPYTIGSWPRKRPRCTRPGSASGYTDKQGRRREYESAYLRRTYREAGKVRHETLANLSGLPDQTVDLIEAALKGTALVPAAHAATITRSLPHGHVAAVHAMATKLGLPALLGPADPERDLALSLVISRVAAPASKLSTLAWWADSANTFVMPG
jgi:hypothetical protein